MTGDTSPLSGHWARYAPQGPTRYERTDYGPLADQLAEELDYVAAGQLDGALVVCRYTGRQLLGAARAWGLLSDRARQLRAILRAAGRA